jgi:hypothetical protein
MVPVFQSGTGGSDCGRAGGDGVGVGGLVVMVMVMVVVPWWDLEARMKRKASGSRNFLQKVFVPLYRRMAWGFQRSRRWPQAASPAGKPPLNRS